MTVQDKEAESHFSTPAPEEAVKDEESLAFNDKSSSPGIKENSNEDDVKPRNKSNKLSFTNMTTYPDGPCPGDDDFDDNNAPARFVINEWAQGTSIHGVPYVTDAILWRFWKRTVWLCLVLVSCSFMIWQISTLISEYRSYKVITDTETITPISLPFPEVTVCNSNGFSKSRKEQYNITGDPTTDEELELISTPLHDFINFTWFNRELVDTAAVWKPRIVPDIGRCWYFSTNQTVRRPAYYGGLKFWADLKQFDYVPSTNFAAVFVWVEQPGTYVDVQLTINSAKPGKESYVKIETSRYVRERQAPWARCQGEAPSYTQARCRSQCSFAFIRQQCGCREYGDDSGAHNVNGALRLCQKFSDPTDSACVADAYARDEEIWSSCPCQKPACAETQFEGYMIETDVAHTWLDNFDYEGWGENITKQYFLDNYVSVTVNYAKIQYELLTESKAVTFAQLLGSIGGSMGLFLGISLLSIFELFGDLGLLRLFPRWFGHKHLFGLGARKTKTD